MSTLWTRTHKAYGVEDVPSAIDARSRWAILWCGGWISRSEEIPLDEDGLAYVLRRVIEPAKRLHLLSKAERKGRTKTVVMAERWEDSDLNPFILFYESGPYPLPDRAEPI